MTVAYSKNYQTENLFGEPYPELIDFFTNYRNKGRLLDLGCGQGREAIPVARLGFEVTGIASQTPRHSIYHYESRSNCWN